MIKTNYSKNFQKFVDLKNYIKVGNSSYSYYGNRPKENVLTIFYKFHIKKNRNDSYSTVIQKVQIFENFPFTKTLTENLAQFFQKFFSKE